MSMTPSIEMEIRFNQEVLDMMLKMKAEGKTLAKVSVDECFYLTIKTLQRLLRESKAKDQIASEVQS